MKPFYAIFTGKLRCVFGSGATCGFPKKNLVNLGTFRRLCGANQDFVMNFGLKAQKECDDFSEVNIVVWNVSVEYTARDDSNCLIPALEKLQQTNENLGQQQNVRATCAMVPGSSGCQGGGCKDVTPPPQVGSVAVRPTVGLLFLPRSPNQ